VFIHAMIQDGHGQKMSKSLGNGVDPVDIIHSHGSDAMRYTLTAMTTQTQDVRMPVDLIDPRSGETFTPKFITGPGGVKVAAPIQEYPPGSGQKMVSSYGFASGQAEPTEAGGEMPLARNTSEKFDLGQRFATKLWNATRFALSNLEAAAKPGDGDPQALPSEPSLADRWILSRTARAIEAADAALAKYDFHNYASGLYQFVWNEVCDWYIEAVKPDIQKPESAASRQVLAAVLDASLRLLHPVMPFITERLWEALNQVAAGTRSVDGLKLSPSGLLVKAPWPESGGGLIDELAERDFGTIQETVKAVRELRSRYRVPPAETVTVSAQVPAELMNRMLPHRHFAETLANYRGRDLGPNVAKPANAAAAVVGAVTLYVHDIVDSDEERARLQKRADELAKQVKGFEAKLGNEKYVHNAPPKLVQETRDLHAAAKKEHEAVVTQLAAL
jgi:valyl-tRNA synthetase